MVIFWGRPILVYFSGDWDVHWGYGLLTHGQVSFLLFAVVQRDVGNPVAAMGLPAVATSEIGEPLRGLWTA